MGGQCWCQCEGETAQGPVQPVSSTHIGKRGGREGGRVGGRECGSHTWSDCLPKVVMLHMRMEWGWND